MNQIKPKSGYWANYPKTYRAEEIATIAQWVATGECGAIIGGSGTGKSNLIGFIHTHPDVLYAQLPDRRDNVHLLHFDINSLPMLNAAFFYRGMIQTLQQAAQDFDPAIAEQIQQLFQNNVNWDDEFTAYSILQATHRILIQSGGMQLVWLLDRFDQACRQLDAQTLNSLRSLRDQFKGQLCYVIATRHPLSRLRNPGEIDEFHEIIAANICRLGPMAERDARWVAEQMAERLQVLFHPIEVAQLLEISGGLPAFMKAACTALAEGALARNSPIARWVDILLERAEFQRNCREIWDDLLPKEQHILQDLAEGNPLADVAPHILSDLISSGMLEAGTYSLFSPIFAQYIRKQSMDGQQTETVSGIAIHPQTQDVLRDGILLDAELTNHEDRLLNYFLAHVSEVCTKEELMGAVWSDEVIVEGVRDDRLAQLIKRLRDKIEPTPSTPSYILTVRGRGYRFVQG